MKMVCATHQGLVRLNNEDSVAVDEKLGWAVLADGMGGLLAGEEASAVAVDVAASELKAGEQDMNQVVLKAHQGVVDVAKAKNYSGKMGTTLMVWSWCNGNPTFSHVGDSRIYSYQAGELSQLSLDHTVAQRMVDEGVITQDQLHTAPKQNVLTQALGMPGMLRPQNGQTTEQGRLLLCSDGLTDLVPAERIEALMAGDSLQDVAEELVKAALDKGGRDNITVAVIQL